MLQEFHSIAALRAVRGRWKALNETVALVPTMGALHRGHLALVEEAKARADRVVVSIFVNPTQFGPHEDFARYPRPLDADLAQLRKVGADAVWLPTVETMYKPGFASTIHVAGVSEGLCGTVRPGHFDGVATVVVKLLLQVTPEIALFGEKDYQQLCVIRQVVRDFDLQTDVLGVPTLRESDGLAMSSRNVYLTDRERQIAPHLYQLLEHTALTLREHPQDVATLLHDGIARLIEAGFTNVDYFELRAAETLAPLTKYQPLSRLLIAARLGQTRLIDNVAVA